MKDFKKLIILCLSFMLTIIPAHAVSIAIDARVGTLGGGSGVSFRLNDYFSMTASINSIQFSMSPDSRDLSLAGKMQLLTTGAVVGWHPFKNSFRFLAGFFYDGNQFKLNAGLKNAVTIKGMTVTPDMAGTSKLNMHYNPVAPFLGVGFDAPFYQDCAWSIFGEAGFLFQGRAKAKIKRKDRNRLSLDVANYIEHKAERAGNKFLLNYFPVLTVGVKVAL